jgi:hypothetical protein
MSIGKTITGGTAELIIYDATHPLTWNDGGGDGTVNPAFPVNVTVPTNAGVSADEDAFTTESIDLTNFDTMIIDISYEIDADNSGEVNAGDIIITVDGNSVFDFTMSANFSTRNDRFVLDISALSVSGIINISIGANGFGSANGDTSITLHEMKLINRAI